MLHRTTPYDPDLRLRTGFKKTTPIEGAPEDSFYRRRTLRPEGTPDWHLMVVIKGTYVISPESKHSFKLQPGSAVLYPPHMPQDQMLDAAFDQGEIFWAHFFPEVNMQPFLDWPKSSVGVGLLKWDQNPTLMEEIKEACGRCVRYIESDYSHSRSLSLLALEEILRLIYQVHSKNSLENIDDRVAKALQHISNNIHLPIHVEDMAKAVGLSASRFSYIFSINMHCGPMEYVEKQRIRRASSQLAYTKFPVGTIAEQCGFSSSYYFAKRFRKYHSMSPTEYRNLVKK